MKKDYSVAILVLTLFAIVGWLAVAAGAYIAFRGAGMRDSVIYIGAGMGFALAGLMLVAAGQLMGAMIDTAQTNAQILDGQARQLSELKAIGSALLSFRPNTEKQETQTADVQPQSGAADGKVSTQQSYRGYELYQRSDSGIYAAGKVHNSLEEARDFIDTKLNKNP